MAADRKSVALMLAYVLLTGRQAVVYLPERRYCTVRQRVTFPVHGATIACWDVVECFATVCLPVFQY